MKKSEKGCKYPTNTCRHRHLNHLFLPLFIRHPYISGRNANRDKSGVNDKVAHTHQVSGTKVTRAHIITGQQPGFKRCYSRCQVIDMTRAHFDLSVEMFFTPTEETCQSCEI